MKLKILIILLGVAMAISGIALAWSGTHGTASRLNNDSSTSIESFSENLFAPFSHNTYPENQTQSK